MTGFSLPIVRDLILVAAALVGGYFVFLLLRLLRMGRKRQPAAAPIPPGPPAAEIPAAETGFLRKEPQLPLHGGPSVGSSSQPTVAPPAPVPDFARELTRSTLEIEVQGLRREIHRLRTELTQLGAEVQQLKTTRSVSPLYSEAMTMAQQGVTAAGISDRCGISMGEAELVAALARGGTDSAFHEEKGEHDDRYFDAGN